MKPKRTVLVCSNQFPRVRILSVVICTYVIHQTILYDKVYFVLCYSKKPTGIISNPETYKPILSEGTSSCPSQIAGKTSEKIFLLFEHSS